MLRWARIAAVVVLTLADSGSIAAQAQGRTPAAVTREKRVALVIGNGNYRRIPALKNPPHDAQSIAAALRRLGFQVIDGYDLDISGTRAILGQYQEAIVDADTTLFYYAGHGLQMENRNFIVPVDAKLESLLDLNFDLIDFSLVLQIAMDRPRTSILILDACRDNPLAAQLGQMKVPVGRGLAIVDVGPASGALIAYATQPGAVAADGQGAHSPFTQALIDNIETPDLEVQVMMRRVRQQVIEATNNAQVPWDSSSLTGDFYFKPGAAATQRRPTQLNVTDRQMDALFWQSVQASQSPEDFHAYLEQFPTGMFATLARNRLQQLEQREAALDTHAPRPLPGQRDAAEEAARAQAVEEARRQAEEQVRQKMAALDAEFIARMEALEKAQAERLRGADDNLAVRQREINERQKALDEAVQRMSSLQSDLTRQREEDASRRDALKKGLSELDAERVRLTAEREDLERRTKELEALRKAADARAAELDGIEAKRKANAATFEAEQARLAAERDALTRDRASVEARAQDLASAPDPAELARQQAQLDKRAAALASKEASLARTQRTIEEERQRRLADLDAEISQKRIEFEREQTAQLAALEQRLAYREDALRRKEAVTDQRDRETKALKDQLASLNAQLLAAKADDEAAYKQKIDEAERRLEAVEAEQAAIADERAKVERAKHGLAEVRAQDEARREELEAAEARQRDQLNAIERDRAELVQDQEALRKRLVAMSQVPDPEVLRQERAVLDTRVRELAARENVLAAEHKALDERKTERLANLGNQLTTQQKTIGLAAADGTAGPPAVVASLEGEPPVPIPGATGLPLTPLATQASRPVPLPSPPRPVSTPLSAPLPARSEPEKPAAQAGHSAPPPPPETNLAAVPPPATQVPALSPPQPVINPPSPPRPARIDKVFLVTKKTAARADASTKAKVRRNLRAGERVTVKFKVPSGNWFAIDGGEGSTLYVQALALEESTPQRLAALEQEKLAAAEKARQGAAERAAREAERVATEAEQRQARLKAEAAEIERRADEVRAVAEARAAELREKELQAATEAEARRREEEHRQVALAVPQLSRDSLIGSWCSGSIRLSVSPERLVFSGVGAAFPVTGIIVGENTITVHFRDMAGNMTVNEFGGFAAERMVQIRGRAERRSEWKSYNRPFVRC